ncbi:MAG TPA: GntR family transcriptional regulator [Burkholderiaceae bacterium]|nr:GntR family transcriptional regulator [Burkholderiaceae bacterium]
MTFSALVTPLKRQTLSADVHGQLRDLLVSGRVMPGEPLSLRSIAEALGVSVMPVREAVHRLVAEQALELTPNRVLRVPMMTVSQFREITSIRINLEGLATARAAIAMNEAAMQDIVGLHERFAHEMSLKPPDGLRLITFNKELHFAVYGQACMPMLLQMIESLWLRIGPILNYDMRSGSARVRERVAVAHHERLVDALKRRDADAASQALRGDIESAADFIVSAGVLVTADRLSAAAVQASAPARPKRPKSVRARANT